MLFIWSFTGFLYLEKHERFFDGIFKTYSMHLATDFTSRRTHMHPAVARKRGMTDGQTDRNTRQSDAYKMALLGEFKTISKIYFDIQI